jgi:predicted small lipoprotein YifL
MALVVACAALSLNACGQKGPLYLPDPPQQQQSVR